MKIKLKMEDLTKVFGDLVAVNNLSLEVLDGEFVCFVGPSGCGKTTTLNMLSGLEEPTRGNIIFDDVVINDLPARRRDIGLIFQDYAIFENMTVYDNLAFSLTAKKTPKDEIDRTVKSVAERLYLTDMLEKKSHVLTPGDLQRIAIGRTMIMAPSVFLLDEPLDNLDADMRITMRGELKRLQKDLGKTMVYVTHDQEEAMSMADRVVVMDNAELQQFDSPENIYNRPVNKFVAEFIGKLPMNFIDGHLQEKSGKLFFVDKFQSIKLDVSKYRGMIKKSTAGKDLCLGLRPEHISVAPSGGKDSFDVVVNNLEVHGMENVVEFRLKRQSESFQRMVAPPEFMPKIDDRISICFHPEKIYPIDPLTEMVLAQT
ncbi:MAG: ATP-binding cassette domain-containing protein [Proteobacteria bacterium]|nr:ATP-binding cassette domain-containing protein [Pseudomonadota bacterium]